MASIRKKACKNGVWISSWKFQSNKKPFGSNLTVRDVVKKQTKMTNYLRAYLRDRKLWAAAGIKYKALAFEKKWEYTAKSDYMVFHLKVILLDALAGPGNIIITPPPPKQPPPPNL